MAAPAEALRGRGSRDCAAGEPRRGGGDRPALRRPSGARVQLPPATPGLAKPRPGLPLHRPSGAQYIPLSSLVPPAASDYRGADLEAKGGPMSRTAILVALYAILLALAAPAAGHAACCYFSAKNADILQPAQKVFISWDPVKKIETFTVQPKFEGNA